MPAHSVKPRIWEGWTSISLTNHERHARVRFLGGFFDIVNWQL